MWADGVDHVIKGIPPTRSKTQKSSFTLLRKNLLYRFGKNTYRLCYTSQSPWDSGPESRRSSWTSISRAPSLHRRSQSGEMESLLSEMHTCSSPSSREPSLDQSEYLQVPMLLSPDCNGTTFHFPEHCNEEAPLPSYYHSDQEEEEAEEVKEALKMLLHSQAKV